MKKRLFAAVIAAMLVLSHAACGKTQKKATDLVTLGQYKGIEVEKMIITVSDDDVTSQIYSNLKGKVVKIDGFEKVKMWDVVDIDFAFCLHAGADPAQIMQRDKRELGLRHRHPYVEIHVCDVDDTRLEVCF